jgi:hypothetical protein
VRGQPAAGLVEEQVHLAVDGDPIVGFERVDVPTERRRVSLDGVRVSELQCGAEGVEVVVHLLQCGRGHRNAHIGRDGAKRTRQRVRLDRRCGAAGRQGGHHDCRRNRMRKPPERDDPAWRILVFRRL